MSAQGSSVHRVELGHHSARARCVGCELRRGQGCAQGWRGRQRESGGRRTRRQRSQRHATRRGKCRSSSSADSRSSSSRSTLMVHDGAVLAGHAFRPHVGQLPLEGRKCGRPVSGAEPLHPPFTRYPTSSSGNGVRCRAITSRIACCSSSCSGRVKRQAQVWCRQGQHIALSHSPAGSAHLPLAVAVHRVLVRQRRDSDAGVLCRRISQCNGCSSGNGGCRRRRRGWGSSCAASTSERTTASWRRSRRGSRSIPRRRAGLAPWRRPWLLQRPRFWWRHIRSSSSSGRTCR